MFGRDKSEATSTLAWRISKKAISAIIMLYIAKGLNDWAKK